MATKKIIILDGGPRKTMNTGALIEAFTEGAKSEGDIEVKRIYLYNMNFKGCVSCLGCKLKGRASNVCVFKDELKPILDEIALADGLVIASPIYLGTITAPLIAALGRMVFPWLSYMDWSCKPPKKMPVAFMYTMNAPKEQFPMCYKQLELMETLIGNTLGGEAFRVNAFNTYQVKDYSLYEFAPGTAEAKTAYRNANWHNTLDEANEAGRSMAKLVTKQTIQNNEE